MRAKEIELLKNITLLESSVDDKLTYIINEGFKLLQDEIFGTVSKEFLQNPAVKSYVNNRYDSLLQFWYLIHTNGPELIEVKIKEILNKYQLELNCGVGIPPIELYSPSLIRSVYLSENHALIDIFKRYLPIPGIDVFKGVQIPEIVTEKQAEIKQSIQSLKNQNPKLSVNELTDNVINIQRRIRSKLRYQEEIKRISSRLEWKSLMKTTTPQQVILNANIPYHPRCADKELAKRIMIAAQQIHLFDTVKHLISEKHIESVFNDSLYGRRNIMQFQLAFRPASLKNCDIEDGDSNVICLGPFNIDPEAMQSQTVEILFDLEKLSANNASIFFKQQDLGFSHKQIRSIIINENNPKPLLFSHTSPVKDNKLGFSHLSVFNNQSGVMKGTASLPNYSLISYNVKKIHQILALNFFRYLDADINLRFDSIKDEIYSELATLSDEQLRQCLESIGRLICDTSEFNFYGAHKIDFSTVIALTYYDYRGAEPYTLKLQDLIFALEHNDLDAFHEAKVRFPGAFKSYRFLDYLLSKTTSVLSRDELQLLRSKCIIPFFEMPSLSTAQPISSSNEKVAVSSTVNNILPSDNLISTSIKADYDFTHLFLDDEDMNNPNEKASVSTSVNNILPSDNSISTSIKADFDFTDIFLDDEDNNNSNKKVAVSTLVNNILSSDNLISTKADFDFTHLFLDDEDNNNSKVDKSVNDLEKNKIDSPRHSSKFFHPPILPEQYQEKGSENDEFIPCNLF